MVKKNNNLVLVNVGEKKHYFTSINKAGLFLGLAPASINWAINRKNELKNNNDEIVTIEIVDGSEVPYKYINNQR